MLDDADLKSSLPACIREITAKAIERDTIMLFVADQHYGVVKRDVVVAANGCQTPWLPRNDMFGEVPLF